MSCGLYCRTHANTHKGKNPNPWNTIRGIPNLAAESVAQGKNMSAITQSGCSCCNSCSSGPRSSTVAFKNVMILSAERTESEFSQPWGNPVSSGEGNLIVLMFTLAFPMVLETRGTLRGVVTTVALIPLEEKTLARSTLGMM